MILFYRRNEAAPDTAGATMPRDLDIRTWRPTADGLPPRGPYRARNLVWWGFAAAGVFARRGFAELSLWRRGRMLHRLIVTPRWYRFPFMARGDLQIGDVWTHPEARGRGLARLAITEAGRRLAADADQLWYLTDSANAASVRLIESCGYQMAGVGWRSRPLGLPLLGRFHLDAEVADTWP